MTFTDYACGDDTPATILKEIRRLMVQQDADVMVGPLSGDEAVATANWAKSHLDKTIIIGTAGSQDPTMQIAPKNVFRYYGDGAQWNAGLGEIVYKKWGWRNAAIIMDDYSFGWTSAAGIIADFCAIGGKITKRVFPPLNTTDYSSYVRQLPSPDDVDGYFWVIGGTGTDPAFKAFEQAYGTLKAKQHSGNLFLWFLTGASSAPKLRGAYIGGFGVGPGLKTGPAAKYRAVMKRYYPKIPAEDSFTLNYYRSAHALVVGLQKSKRSRGSCAAEGAATGHPGSVPAVRGRQGQAGQPPPGHPGPVADADQRVGEVRDLDRGVRAKRRPDVRRHLRTEQARSWPRVPVLPEAEAAVAGQDQGGQERQGHELGDQVGG